MEMILTIVFIVALIICVYLMNKKPTVDQNALKSLDDLQGLQSLAKLFILADDSITAAANNHTEYYAKKLIDKRVKSFENRSKNYIHDSIIQSESNNKVLAACCDASGNFNASYTGQLGIIYTKLKIIVNLVIDPTLNEQSHILDRYVYVEKNFNELNLLFDVLNQPVYSYYLTSHSVDELNSIDHCLDRLISVFNGYEPNFKELDSVEYGRSIISGTSADANQRQLKHLQALTV